jgi:hypothetical protein
MRAQELTRKEVDNVNLNLGTRGGKRPVLALVTDFSQRSPASIIDQFAQVPSFLEHRRQCSGLAFLNTRIKDLAAGYLFTKDAFQMLEILKLPGICF